ncbi:MAG: M20 metallopeptidase family protein [Dehalococcoidia bacterium]
MDDRQSLNAWGDLPAVSADVRAMAEPIVGWRRHLHREPEVSHEEHETQRWLMATLLEFGIDEVRGVAGTGVVAVIRGRADGPTVIWRADIDALPIVEESTAPYISRRHGVMHACGHDGHTAIALGAAKLLHARRGELPGPVKVVFQPAEEVGGGARPMLAAGVLEDPPVEAAFGLHVDSSLETGTIGVSAGAFMPSPGSFDLRISGRGGHAGLPHRSIDPVVTSAYVLTALQTVISRNLPPDRAGLLSIGEIKGGTRGNIIPDEVMIAGTVRAFEPEILKMLRGRMEQVVAGVCAAFGAEFELEFREGLPAVVNDPAMAALVRGTAEEALGEQRVLPDRTTMSDDMSLFLEARPGCYFLLGVRNEGWGIVEPNHSPRWDLDERALVIGVELASRVVLAASTKLTAG